MYKNMRDSLPKADDVEWLSVSVFVYGNPNFISHSGSMALKFGEVRRKNSYAEGFFYPKFRLSFLSGTQTLVRWFS